MPVITLPDGSPLEGGPSIMVARHSSHIDAIVPLLVLADNDRLARYKHPKDVIPIDALPRNALGKVLKFELRAMLAGG